MKKYKDLKDFDDEDDMPLYNLEDEDLAEDNGVDDNDNADSESVGNNVVDGKVKKKPSPFIVMFRIMMTPVEGWKILKRAGFKTDTVASGCFYPLLALSAISVAANIFYEANFTMSDWVVNGFSLFLTFFFGYFSVLLVGANVLPQKSRELMKKDIGKQLVMITMSTLALFSIFINLFPMVEPVLVFLPLWTIYLIFKGVRVLKVNRDVENTTTCILCIMIIGFPILWNWIFTEVLMPLAQ